MSEAVRNYYNAFDEWARLETSAGRLEFERTLRHLVDRIPPHSAVLDVGGGPGRYTMALAARGHEVWLLDPSEALIHSASSRIQAAGLQDRVVDVSIGDIRDLSRFDADCFDTTLALGPFYHLIESDSRRTAAAELFRTLRPGGEAFVSIIPHLSGLAGLVARAASDPEQVPPAALDRVVSEGVYLNPTDRGFQEGYYPQLSDIEGLFLETGFELVDRFSIRGLAFGAEEAIGGTRTDSDSIERLIESTCREDTVLNLCGHVLLTARKPNPSVS